MAIDIRFASTRERLKPEVDEEISNLVTPGDVITSDTGFMRGHGTFMEDGKHHASVAGIVQRVNKLICVTPLKTRYNGEVGDIVVGRIIEVGMRRWKVDVHAKLDAILMLSSVNLPGGELRRRSEEDEKLMRNYLQEGDLISAEVQSVFSDGSLSLHTRSLKYGKLGQGTLYQVSPSLIKRRKTHFHNLPYGATVILGNNGYIWICPTAGEVTEQTGGYEQDLEACLCVLQIPTMLHVNEGKTLNSSDFHSVHLEYLRNEFVFIEPVTRADREVMARLGNCVQALADHKMMLYDTSILYAYEASLKFQVKDIMKPEVINEIIDLTRQRLERDAGS